MAILFVGWTPSAVLDFEGEDGRGRPSYVSRFLIGLLALLLTVQAGAADDFPPGWLPISHLDGQPSWREVRDDQEHVRLYLPQRGKPVRGVFVCFVFHSGDLLPHR